MGNEKFLVFGKNKLEIIEINPFIKFAKRVFGSKDDILITDFAYEHSNEIIKLMLNTLIEKECKVIRYLFGLNCEEKNYREIAELFNTSEQMIEKIAESGLRKIRSGWAILSGEKAKIKTIANFYGIYYMDNLKAILRAEVDALIKENKKANVFLNNIMKRYNINIENITYYMPACYEYDCDIEDMDLEVRDYNCLRRAGIKTYSQLRLMSWDEIANIRNLGSKSFERVKAAMERCGQNDDETNTIVFLHNNEKTVYKYIDVDIDKISKSIYCKILNLKPSATQLFNFELSPALMHVLLQKGYLYIEDVFNDSTVLIQQLKSCDFENLAYEIEYLVKKYGSETEAEILYLRSCNDEVYKFVTEQQCTSASDFIMKCTDASLDSVKQISSELSEWF